MLLDDKVKGLKMMHPRKSSKVSTILENHKICYIGLMNVLSLLHLISTNNSNLGYNTVPR